MRAFFFIMTFFSFAHIGFAQKIMRVKVENLAGDVVQLPNIMDSSSLAVVVFYSPECPLCKNYTLTLNQLVQDDPQLTVVAVYSGTDYDVQAITDFNTKYNNQFITLRDKKYKLAKAFGATVTPEVFLIDSSGNVIYSGLIDNWVIKLGGSHRREITAFYLTDAITSYRSGITPAIQQTQAKGCLLYAN